MLTEHQFRNFKVLAAMFFSMLIFFSIRAYYDSLDYEEFIKDGKVTTGKLTRYQDVRGKYYYLYFYKVGDKYLKSEEYFYENKFPHLYEHEVERLSIYVLYRTEGNYRSKIIFDSLPKQ